jgi:uncharacterized protein with GYD domain
MATYCMLGKYTAEAVKGISPERTGKADALIKKFGGKITTGYILLGAYDLVLVVDLPGNDQALQFSLAMNKLTGIAFETCPGITLAEFDRLSAAT